MVGTAERALLTRYRSIVEAVRRVVGESRPLSPSGSAFRLAYDPRVGRDALDVSVVAVDLGLLQRSVDEQPFQVPLADAVDALEELERRPLLPTGRVPAVATTGPPTVAVHTAVGALTSAVNQAEVLLVVPSRVLGCDRADLACRAYENGWYAEAERLFLEATDQLPTEPYLWFAAAMAAGHLDADRTVAHLRRSARYLATIDPAAAVYVDLVAADVLDRNNDRAGAVRLLRARRDQLGQVCSVLWLHLARLDPASPGHLRAALEADPLLEADLVAVRLPAAAAAIDERRRLTMRELDWLAYSISELRGVDDGPSWDDPDEEAAIDDGDGQLPLSGLEVRLWHRLQRCEHEVRLARHAVSVRGDARVAKEAEISRATEVAAGDLGYRAAVSVLIAAVAVAAGLLGSFVAVEPLQRVLPVSPWLISGLAVVGRVGLVAFFIVLAGAVIWPRRHFRRARRARDSMPRLEWQAASLRQSEFEARRRFNQANQAAELRIRRIVDRRRQLVPRRPRFLTEGPIHTPDVVDPAGVTAVGGESAVSRWGGPPGE